jgi:hypothetical protein
LKRRDQNTILNPLKRVFAMSLGIHSKVVCATHESFANSIPQFWGGPEFRRSEFKTKAGERLNLSPAFVYSNLGLSGVVREALR